MSNQHVHPIFQGLLKSISPPQMKRCSCGVEFETWDDLCLHWKKGAKRGWPCATKRTDGAKT